MNNEDNNAEELEKRKKHNRNVLVVVAIVVGGLISCCFGLLMFGTYLENTPEGKATATARTIEKEATSAEQTVVAMVEATEAAKPTPTPAPTNTPEPTNTPLPPTNTPEPEERLTILISEALGSSNRDVEKVTDVSLVSDIINVEWTINDNFTEDMIKGGAKLEIVDILQAIDESDIDYSLINLTGTFPLVDSFGNSEEVAVIKVSYSSDTVDQINWSSFLFKNVYVIADSVNLHPTFQDN